jgi:transposase
MRGPYNKVDLKDRERIVKAYTDGRDWLTLAKAIGISPQTARSIIATFQRTGRIKQLPKGGDKRGILNEAMKQSMTKYIEEKPTMTLMEVRTKLQTEYPSLTQISLCTISRALDGLMITLKDVRAVPMQWNTDEVKLERRAYAQWLMNEGVQKNLIFMDEFGANIWTSRSKGWSPSGQRSVRVVEGQRGENLTLVLAISPIWGLVHAMFVEGSFSNQHFVDFISELEVLVDSSFVLMCDNARPHNNGHMDNTNHDLSYLPRYSPFINCAERAGSAVKAAVKRELSEPGIQIEIANREAAHLQNLSLYRHRLNILKREMTLEDC